MNRRMTFTVGVAGGGLVAAAFLQAAAAIADPTDPTGPSATGADAFNLGGYTFDPYTYADPVLETGETEGFAPVNQLASSPPLLQLGGGVPEGVAAAPQNFEVYSPSDGTDLGSIDTGVTVANLFGLTNTEFTVQNVNPTGDADASDLPATGSVYDVFNLGNGYANIYTAIPGTGDAGDTVTDTFVTPYGNYDLSSVFGNIDVAAPLQPGDAFTGLEGAATSAGGDDAFAIGNTTLDPFTDSGDSQAEGFAPVSSAAAVPPLLNFGGVTLNGDPTNAGNDLATQDFTVYNGTGSDATDVGTIQTGEDVTNLLGLTNTQLIVTDATPASDADASDLPATGTVFDAFNLGNGYENVYVATPGADGTVTDTLVTPFGNVDLSSLFSGIDAATPLDAGAAFTGLEAGDSAIGADAFTIGSTTFDPMTTDSSGAATEGFNPAYQMIGAPPLLNIGGDTPGLNLSGTFFPLPNDVQDFDVYSGSGASVTEVGSITTNVDVTDLLGLTNTEFTVTDATPTGDAEASDLPAVGSVYDVFNLGNGYENIYTAIPGSGDAGDTVTDTFVTPFGNIDLSSLFGDVDAAQLLMPGDAFTGLGVDAASDASTDVGTTAASDPLAFLGL
jgi:hypothetical protein